MDYTSETIVGRIKYLIRKRKMTQAEFAHRLGMDPSNLSKQLTGRLPVTDSLINRIVVELGVSKEWLKNGDELPFAKDGGSALEVMNIGDIELVRRGVPVYDIDVTAGCEELSMMFTRERITGYISLPRISQESLIVRVSGDSMTPEIADGGYIAIRPVKSVDTIFWGHVYVVVTEDYRLVKYVRRHPKDDSKVLLHSANPAYDDMEINRSEIRCLFYVEAILNCKICG